MSEGRGRLTGHPAEAGETLVELLVSIVILGITSVAIIGSLMLAVDVSKMHEQHVLVRQTLHAWAEEVRNTTDDAYDSCGTTCMEAKAPSAPGVSASVTRLECANGTTSTTCGSGADSLKRVTLRVTGSALAMPAVSESLTVTLRRPCLEDSTC